MPGSTAQLITRVEIKAVDTGQRLITGYAGVSGNKDRVGDVIDKGAFDRTIKENPDVLVLVGHDASRMPVGEPKSMVADDHGLLTMTRVYKTAAGDELLEVAAQRMASGRTLGMSIGYRAVKSGYVGSTRHLKDIDLLEYSFLASPALAANPEAVVTGVKRRKDFGGTSTIEESYEDLQDDLRRAASAALENYCQVVATFPDHVIVAVYGAAEVEGEASACWDFPYTLGADGEPTLGDPKPVQPAFVAGAAKARAKPVTPTPERKVDVKDLPDSAFAFIGPNVTLDEEKKSVPRSARHFPHHTEAGELDLNGLSAALADPDMHTHGPVPVAHLMRHAKAAGLLGEKSARDDAHDREWNAGAAPRIFVLAAQLSALSESVVGDQKAMERLGIETKSGDRLYAVMQAQLKALHAALGQILDQAESVDRGEDGTAQIEVFRRAFEFLDLEEVA